MARSGVTEKISISVKRSHLQFLKKRAKGNVSAAIAELIESEKRNEARIDLLRWLRVPPLTDEEREAIRREQERAPKAKKKRAA